VLSIDGIVSATFLSSPKACDNAGFFSRPAIEKYAQL